MGRPSALEITPLNPTDYDVLGWIDRVPTMAAAAFHHGRSRAFRKGVSLDRVFRESEEFATGDYTAFLTRGASMAAKERARVLSRLADLLGLSEDLVVRGEGRGRKLGIPTANVDAEGELLPATGIYAVRLRVLDGPPGWGRMPGAASLGTNPTFAGGKLTLEVHLFDFDQDIYGKRVRVEFIERLRAERRFDSVPALVEQIQRDIAESRRILEKER